MTLAEYLNSLPKDSTARWKELRTLSPEALTRKLPTERAYHLLYQAHRGKSPVEKAGDIFIYSDLCAAEVIRYLRPGPGEERGRWTLTARGLRLLRLLQSL